MRGYSFTAKCRKLYNKFTYGFATEEVLSRRAAIAFNIETWLEGKADKVLIGK